MTENAFFRIIRFLIALLTIFVASMSIFAYIGANYGGMFQIFALYGLFQPLLIIINFLLFIYWAVRLRILVILPFVALLLNIGFISSVFQFSRKVNHTENSGDSRIVIGTYNVKGFYHGQRPLTVSLISDFMKEKDVNILCLQEFDFDSTYTVDSIARAFSYLPYRSLALSEVKGFSLIILSKYPILRSTRIRFGKTNNQAMWVDLRIKNDTIRVFNYHLQTTNFNQAKFPLIPENWLLDLSGEAKKSLTVYEVLQDNFRKRTRQANFIHSQVDVTILPTLVCGDMNSNPSSHTYHQIKGHLNDGFRTCGSGYEYTLLGLYRLYRVDYVFHSDDFEGYNYKSYKLDYSDHKPVIMELSLKPH